MKKNSQVIETTQPTEDQKQLLSKIFPIKKQEPIKTLDIEEKIELERRETYIEANLTRPSSDNS